MVVITMPTLTGRTLCLYLTCSYVFSLYLIPSEVRKRPRDDPVHVSLIYHHQVTLDSSPLQLITVG